MKRLFPKGNPESSAPRPPRRFWRVCRICFRRFRIAVWLLLFGLVAVLVYLNQIGLPEIVKKPLLEKLRARGVDLQFSRLRLSWFEGVVAEQVRFGRSQGALWPELTASEVQVRINARALARRQVQVDSLLLRNGKFSWPIPEANSVPRRLTVDHIQTEVRLLPQDQWALDNFKATFQGAHIHLAGVVTNASAIRDLELFQAKPQEPGAAGKWQRRLRRLADTLEHVHFSHPPELNLRVYGDAKDLQSFSAYLTVAAPGAQTPWGTVSQGRAELRIRPEASNALSHAELDLWASEAQTAWGSVSNFTLAMGLTQAESFTNDVHGVLQLKAAEAGTPWASASNFVFSANWIHSITNPVPLSGHGEIQCDNAQTRWVNSRKVKAAGHLETAVATKSRPAPDSSWGWWTNLAPYDLSFNCELTRPSSPGLEVESVLCRILWSAPGLTISNLQANIGARKLSAAAELDVPSRRSIVRLTSHIDPQTIAPVLTEGARKWLRQFTWASPPDVRGQIALTLPAWTNRAPDWRAEVQPTLVLEGQFAVTGGGSYRGLQADTASSHFSYSNMCWHLPDLAVTRDGGRLEAEHRENDRTKAFYWRLKSTVQPAVARPLLKASEQRALDLLELTDAPAVSAEVWGVSHHPERTSFRGHVSLTNFSFRGQSASSLESDVTYTNQILTFLAPQIECGPQHLKADGLRADFNSRSVYLTNGYSTAEPLLVARAIGPNVAKAIEPYRFEQPPTARVHGTIPMHGEEGADLHFDLEGGPFHWWKFRLPYIAGHVHWAGLGVNLSEMRCQFYDGLASGAAGFFFPKEREMEFHFTATVTNALLQALMADLSERTNRLEGRLSGDLVVTHATGSRSDSVQGYGNLHLKDGLIWDIPLFGMFSPVLDGIVPGLGTSRASAANSTFLLTNGVIHTDDLEIRAPALRLQYRGDVDLESRVNARVEAELLRDMWVVGPLVSTVLWPVAKMFEYRVTGSLSEPKLHPVYIIPKLVLMPFQPFRWLKSLVPEEDSRTNAPPPMK